MFTLKGGAENNTEAKPWTNIMVVITTQKIY
jgi:hypothetical protein